ncbi:hypothetical protein NESM_000195100 [Novymonas esmeraldas]|uniref:Tubulin--tyrosine ligase-like protein 12 SET-like domain-containing protein n=1 Tax=Novymonas esmeraldas TaxID=1808958 RepID=A0AAW0F884_9TRYP
MQTYEEFQAALEGWLVAAGVPMRLHRRLHDKIRGGVFDSGRSFALARWARETDESESGGEDSEEEAAAAAVATPASVHHYPGYYLVANCDLRAEEDIWLVDHCCTFQLPTLRDALTRDETLRRRLETIVRLEPAAEAATAVASVEQQVDRLWAHLWPYVGTYTLLNPRHDDAHEHYWFVADEIGSALHCAFEDDADAEDGAAGVNTQLLTLPFYFAAQQCVFSLMWLTAPVEAGAVLTRRPRHRFEPYCGKAVSRVLCESWSGEPPKPDVVQACRAAWQEHRRRQTHVAARRTARNEVEEEANRESQQRRGVVVAEAVYPPICALAVQWSDRASADDTAPPLPVYVSHRGVASALAASPAFRERAGATGSFRLVSLPGEAAVVWMTNHAFRGVSDFAGARYVVHLPEEAQLTVPRHLAALLQTAVGHTPLVVDHLDAVSQLRELVGSAVEEGGTEGGGGAAESVWELRSEDGRRVWGPATLSDWPRVRELLRVAETAPLCAKRVVDAEALSLVAGARMVLHIPVLVRSLRSAATALDAYVHRFSWASFAPLAGGAAAAGAAAGPPCRAPLSGDVVWGQLAALTGRAGVWETEVLPALRRLLRDVLVAVTPADGVDHARRGAVWEAQFQLVLQDGGAAAPVLLGFDHQLDYGAVLQLAPSLFEDVLNTLCLGSGGGGAHRL